MDGKDCFFSFSCIIISELDETEDAALEMWESGFFCADLQALFCDVNWVQRGLRQGHIKPKCSATQ